MRKLSGFTLVELLVAVALVAVLSAIGLVAYTSVSKQARDSKRIADLRTIQSALEQYYNDQGFYPYCINGSSHNTWACGLINTTLSLTDATDNPAKDPNEPVKTYLSKLPLDPVNVVSGRMTGWNVYYYISLPSYDPPSRACDNSTEEKKCTSYCLYTKVENAANASLAANCPDSLLFQAVRKTVLINKVNLGYAISPP